MHNLTFGSFFDGFHEKNPKNQISQNTAAAYFYIKNAPADLSVLTITYNNSTSSKLEI